MRLGNLGQSNGFNMQASYDSMFGSAPLSDTSASPTNTTPTTSSSSTPASMSTADLNALFGGASSILPPQGSDPLASLGSPQYVTPSAGTPAPSSDLSLIGSTITQAGKLFQYVSGVDANGNPAAVPQQVASGTSWGAGAGGANMLPLLLIGGLAFMMLK